MREGGAGSDSERALKRGPSGPMVRRDGGRAARLQCTQGVDAARREAGAGSGSLAPAHRSGTARDPAGDTPTGGRSPVGERVDDEGVGLHAASWVGERRGSCSYQGGCAKQASQADLCGKRLGHHGRSSVRHACRHRSARLVHHCSTSDGCRHVRCHDSAATTASPRGQCRKTTQAAIRSDVLRRRCRAGTRCPYRDPRLRHLPISSGREKRDRGFLVLRPL